MPHVKAASYVQGIEIPTGNISNKPREKFDPQQNESLSLVTPVQISQHQSISDAIVLSKKYIEDHLQQRLISAFQQYVACYGTNFEFEEGSVEHQGPSEKKQHGILFNAAHSSTVPCLYAKDADGKPFVYLKFSDSYFASNSTIGIVKAANNGDIAIDGRNAADEKIRTKHMQLLSRVALSEIKPDQALKQLFKDIREQVQLSLLSATSPTREVLEIYQQTLDGVALRISSPEFFDQLLNVTNKGTLSERARQIIYRERYAIIQASEAIKSNLYQRINTVKAEIRGIERKPDHYDIVFKAAILRSATPSDRIVLEKLFCLSFEALENTIRTTPRCGKAKALLEKNVNKISVLYQDLRPLIIEARKKESEYQRNLLRKLRECSGHSQKSLAALFKERFPSSVMSQPTLCRTERGERPASKQLLEGMASVLGIAEENFFPRLFASIN